MRVGPKVIFPKTKITDHFYVIGTNSMTTSNIPTAEKQKVGLLSRIKGKIEPNKSRVIFIGASGFGLSCLKMMKESSLYSLVGVITAPEIFSISYRPEGVKNVLYANIKNYCDLNRINCLTISKGMKDGELLNRVKDLEPDIFIVVGWYHMIPPNWIEIAPFYGLHASLLPDYSGGAPLVWAIINGEKKTGITLFQIANGVDNGPILGQLATNISSEDTIRTVYDRIELLGLDLLNKHLPEICDGSVKLTIQEENQRRIFPQRGPKDGKIDWSIPSNKIYDFVRAQTKPYPGAFSKHGNDKVTIWSCRIDHEMTEKPLAPSEIKETSKRILVGCGQGSALEILEIAVNDKDTSAYDWWRKNIDTEKNSKFQM